MIDFVILVVGSAFGWIWYPFGGFDTSILYNECVFPGNSKYTFFNRIKPVPNNSPF